MAVLTVLKTGGALPVKCSSCKRVYLLKRSLFDHLKPDNRLSAQCLCGEPFVVAIESRKHPRKRAPLRGGYLHEGEQFRGSMQIVNLSKSGAGVEIHTGQRMFRGDRLKLRFNLDDDRHSYVEKSAVIRRKSDDFVGLEFVGGKPESGPLDAYLDA